RAPVALARPVDPLPHRGADHPQAPALLISPSAVGKYRPLQSVPPGRHAGTLVLMKIRRRTLRRLTAFVLVLAVGLAIGLWLKGRGDRRHAEHLQAERARGLHLLTMGEHAAALQPLGRYLSDADPERVEADVEARLAYAQAR